jgi:nicotinamide-nucleotide amidase
MKEEVLPRLTTRFSMPAIAHRTVFTFGAGESYIAEKLVGFEAQLPEPFKLAYLPNYGMVRLRLTATGEDPEALRRVMDEQFAALCALVEDITVVKEDLSMEAYMGRLLLEKNQTVATAESCTGGTIAQLLTSIPGSSAWFKGGVVSYAEEVKVDLLAVPAAVITEAGVVSEAVVTQMVRGALAHIRADYAIATSGIMGPDGGSAEIPVGTVWIAVGDRRKVKARAFHFRYTRGMNIQLTAINALNLLRLFILEG